MLVGALLLWQGIRLIGDLSVDAPAAAESVADDDADHSGEVATNGEDYSKVSAEGAHVLVCDEEADENAVRGEATVEQPDGQVELAFEDTDGADGMCVAVPIDGSVLKHRVCERNHAVWTCGNWQAGS